MTELLKVDDAIAQILASIPAPKTEIIRTEESLGRILAETAHAAIDLPPFANSSMDGFAVRSEDITNTPTILQVVMDIPAGVAPQQTLQAGEAARIMTGAPVPDGADAVVPVEATDQDWDNETDPAMPMPVEIREGVKSSDNVRPVGENIRQGDVVLEANTKIYPQDIGMLVALGITEITVYRTPKVVILSTGNELIGIDDPLTPGKIRDTNSYTIAGLVMLNGSEAVQLPPAKDTVDDVRNLFEQALALEPDVIVSSAGVSVGKHDVVRTVLDELGEIGFWRVNVRPGKPLAFGQVQGIPFFGLPGNPVSAMITFELFVRPVLCKLTEQPVTASTSTAFTAEEMTSDGRRTYARVKLFEQDGKLMATTTGTQSSGALMSMVIADGLLIIPEGTKQVPAGTELQVRLLRDQQ